MNSSPIVSKCSKHTHLEGNMYKYSQCSLPYFKCNFLIVSKTSFFDIHGPAQVFFKGVSSLSELCSSGNLDALLDDVSGQDDISLVSESELSSDESLIVSSAIRTRSLFPNSIITTQCDFRSFLSLVYHSHHF